MKMITIKPVPVALMAYVIFTVFGPGFSRLNAQPIVSAPDVSSYGGRAGGIPGGLYTPVSPEYSYGWKDRLEAAAGAGRAAVRARTPEAAHGFAALSQAKMTGAVTFKGVKRTAPKSKGAAVTSLPLTAAPVAATPVTVPRPVLAPVPDKEEGPKMDLRLGTVLKGMAVGAGIGAGLGVGIGILSVLFFAAPQFVTPILFLGGLGAILGIGMFSNRK